MYSLVNPVHEGDMRRTSNAVRLRNLRVSLISPFTCVIGSEARIDEYLAHLRDAIVKQQILLGRTRKKLCPVKSHDLVRRAIYASDDLTALKAGWGDGGAAS